MSYHKYQRTLSLEVLVRNYLRECLSILKELKKVSINSDWLRILEFKYLHTRLMEQETIEPMMIPTYLAY